jgi:hypothetical protein
MAQQRLVVVFDASISPRICWAIQGFCSNDPTLQFKCIDSRLKDDEWLDGEFPAEPPHAVIAKDSVLRPRGQALVWLKGGLTVVIVDGRLGNIGLEQLAGLLLRWWPVIEATIRGTPRHGAFMVPVRFTKRTRLPKWTLKPRQKKKAVRKRLSVRQKQEHARRRDNRQGRLDLPDVASRTNSN